MPTPVTNPLTGLTDQQLATRQAIIQLLTNYGPELSKTMITSHIASYGSNYRINWEKELSALIRAGVVVRETRLIGDTARPIVVFYLKDRKPN